MRLLFFNSCLEPGRDGVGDHVRLLAGACRRLGHACAIVALNDPFVTEPVDPLSAQGIDETRLPAAMDWERRSEWVRAFRERFAPDWISFHLVPYAFQKRGMLHGLIPSLHAVTEGVPLHLMFHELWLGAGRPSPWRHYVTGQIQSWGIRRLLDALRPRRVTASNPVYAGMLRRLGTDAKILPLFGNVPVAANLPSLDELLPPTGITAENRADWQIGLFFGALHEQWKPEPLLGLLQDAARRARKKICLVLAGRAGRAGEIIWQKMEREYGSNIVFVNRGEQSPETISALLQTADFGLAASPWQLIGKSGTVAAMLDHGLPVIVTRDDFHPFHRASEPPTTDPLVHRCDELLAAKLAAGLPKRAPKAQVDEIAAQFLRTLFAP